jgi:hypothetical protein
VVEREETEGKTEVPIPAVSEALESIRVVNHLYKSRARNSKIVSQVMDTEEHLEHRHWTSRRRQLKLTDYVRLAYDCECLQGVTACTTCKSTDFFTRSLYVRVH